MLSDFITQNRSEILKRSRARVANRSAPRPTDEELENGIPQFLDQLIKALPTTNADVEFDENAAKHGADLLRMGFSIAHRLRERSCDQDETERLGYLAHELRNKIHTAMLAYETIKRGQLGLGGSTGAVLDRSLRGLQHLITQSLTEVRVEAGIQNRERVLVCELVEELQAETAMLADASGHLFSVDQVDAELDVDADRPLLAAAYLVDTQIGARSQPESGPRAA